jgi:hypothetical protein
VGAQAAQAQLAKQTNTTTTSSQQKMGALMQKLDDLLLLESAKPYLSSWDELKTRVAQLMIARQAQVNVDNQHVAKLTQAVEALVSNQKKQAPAKPLSYAAALKNAPA